jgi:3-phosphoshikimate 1-carboxyvinyltransferase
MNERGLLDAERLEVVPAGPLAGAVKAPSSKSVCNRLLMLAALAEGESHLGDLLESDDTAVMIAGLRQFGAGMTPLGSGDSLRVAGTGGRLSAPAEVVGCGLSGTTLRFLVCVALLVRGGVTLDGLPPLRRRPLGGLLDALVSLGATVTSDGGHPPVTVSANGLRGGRVVVDAAASSQFATGLLLVAPYAAEDLVIEVRNLGAAGYVGLTTAAMTRWGAVVEEEGASFKVAAGRHYGGRAEVAEYDASAAAHIFALAMATGGSVTVSNARPTLQPDAGLVGVFEQMGATVTESEAGLSVTRSGRLLGVEVDVAAMPDQVPTLAVLGALAEGRTTLRGVAVARGHESDRVAAVEVGDDTLVVDGGRPLHGGVVNTYDDHRMAMALSALALVVPGIEISDPGCVRKTYPGYWSDLARLGVQLRAK